jgi:hypothetical protein
MNKITLLFSLSMLLSVATSAQTKPVKTSNTKRLPDCVIIKDGKLQAKVGYMVTVSPDGKTFTVSNAKGVGGTFNCSCSVLTNGTCSATVNGGVIICTGDCGCSISVVITGVTYAVDLSAGILRKS